MNKLQSYVESAALHLSLFACLVLFVYSLDRRSYHDKSITVEVTLEHESGRIKSRDLKASPKKAFAVDSNRKRNNRKNIKNPRQLVDFRPDFIRSGLLFQRQQANVVSRSREYLDGVGHNMQASESVRQEILNTESKVHKAFDRLAELISMNLDYPDLLVEFGIEGLASLDLYFDSNGEIDEHASKYLGSSRLLRGVLVQASRKGLIQWFSSDAKRLNRDQFKNQHYRADFTISSFLSTKSTWDRNALGRYQFMRRRTAENCVAAAGKGAIGLDASCITIKAVGWIRERFSATHRLQFEALKDRMEQFDELQLTGINDLIRQGTT